MEAPLYTQAKPGRQRGHGGDRDRTDDPLLAKQVLSQLSYAPKVEITSASQEPAPHAHTDHASRHPGNSLFAKGEKRMGQGGLEPPTPRLSSVCSNQLSYWPPRSINTTRGGAQSRDQMNTTILIPSGMRGRRLPTSSRRQTSINPDTDASAPSWKWWMKSRWPSEHPDPSSEEPGRPTDIDRGWLAYILGAIKCPKTLNAHP